MENKTLCTFQLEWQLKDAPEQQGINNIIKNTTGVLVWYICQAYVF